MIVGVIKRIVAGFFAGAFVGNTIAVISSGMLSGGEIRVVSEQLMERCGSEMTALFVQSFFSGLIGAAGIGGMLFFEIESWSMLKTVLIHYSLIQITFILSAYFLYWIPSPSDGLIMVALMTVAYFVIWIIMSAVYRAQVAELNQKQQELNQKQ